MRSFFQLLLALLRLAVLIWAVREGYYLLHKEQLVIDPATRSIVVIAAILSIICTFMLTSAIAGHGEKTFRSAQFSHRLEVYQRFIHIWGALSAELDTRKDLRLDLDFKTLEDEFILLASPKVLKAFNEWKKVAVQEGVNTTISKNTRQDLLLCMREDLGQPVDYFARKEIQLNR